MTVALRPLLRRFLLCVGLTLLLTYSMLPLSVSAPNERSRLYLTVALVERGSFDIDVEFSRFGRILDVAKHEGHLYTDKAPGSSLLAVPAYAVLRTFVPPSSITVSQLLLLGRFAVMLPLSLVGFFVLEALARALGVRQSIAHFAAWASIVATTAFHYAVAFFGHHIVAVLWLLACLLIVQVKPERSAWGRLRPVAVGFLLAFAQLTEYQALPGTVVLAALWCFIHRAHWLRSVVLLLLGALPLALFLAYYQVQCFGGPFELSYHHLANPTLAALHQQGIGGVTFPTWVGLGQTLFSWHRGLIATSPLLALAPFGIVGLWRRGHVPCAVAFGVVVTASVLFMSGALPWEAGWGYGPRLLLPVVPLMVVLVAAAAEWLLRASWFWALLVSAFVASLLCVQAVTAFFPEPPNELKNPLLDVVLLLGKAGIVLPNSGSRWLSLQGIASLFPLAILLLWPFVVLYRTALSATQSRRWLLGLPVVPLLIGMLVHGYGYTQGSSEQRGFVRFVAELRER